mmetsp:Transcript_6111/g.8286  ORF Transcript_6111/g.8286 Transcript_6111/m.8286 type:complete len:384 (-) Transcript_6111:171-1322(-)|eukprot:CAMPEP_0196592180 /NCGR_PEP_ID=MMETSP1081-20130531/71970_1 /TAXON_ID=36882 /ORGANISM="Pyramimonas amylifera, Strain CCMP720" /LENGTH=383 /DNA_ID=CAMNT_0041915785 /DNA_START=154 /DNA_END=1305 /DNA_ORIENTATION=-
MMMTLEMAMHVAGATNRTLIIPPSRNDRYNWLRFDAALDMEALRGVWPCFLGSNQEWGTQPAPTTLDAPETVRKLLGKKEDREGKVSIAAHRGLAPSDYHPKPGTIGSLPPVNGIDRVHGASISNTVADVAGEKHMSRPQAKDAPIIRIGGSAWGGLMTMCPESHLSAKFWKYVKPNADIKEEVDAFRAEKLGGVDNKYVAVHLRWLEGKCVGRAESYYTPAMQAPIGAMCSIKYKFLQKIREAKGRGNITHLFIASDRQRPDADKDFEKNGAVSYDRGNKKDKYYGDGTHFVKGRSGALIFEPAVDMFLLVGADLFVGNMLSTFSTSVTAIRYADGERESVLAWPEPQHNKPFWECERAHFWCGVEMKTFSSHGHTKRHGTC